jgi:GH25 family lysozyme M1 (1,4-beta-N-acetylmuramidase)
MIRVVGGSGPIVVRPATQGDASPTRSATFAPGSTRDSFEPAPARAAFIPSPPEGCSSRADDERSAKQVAADNATSALILKLERQEGRFVRIAPDFHSGFDLTSPGNDAQVQANLVSHLTNAGFPPGVDAALPEGGSAAVSAFQTSQGLPATGIVDLSTWNALSWYSEPVNAPAALSLGQQSNAVLYLQLELKQLYPNLDYTGTYDAATSSAVADFKAKHGIDSSDSNSAGWVTQQELADAVRNLPGFSAPLQGVDVSGWQPNTNWSTVRKYTDVRFTFMKVDEGLDNGAYEAQFARDWKESRANGVIRSPYCLFHAEENPVEQADQFVALINANGGLKPTDLPPTLDLEYTYGVSSQKTLDNALAWLKEVKRLTGRTPIIYTYLPWWNGDEPDKWGKSMSPNQYSGAARQHFVSTLQQLGQYPLFISDVGRSQPRVPFPWTRYFAYQYDFGGRPAGIPSNAAGGVTDLDRLNVTFQQLVDQGFISAGSPPPQHRPPIHVF